MLLQSVEMGPQEKHKEEKDYYGGLQSGHYNHHHTVKRETERIRDVDRKWIRRSGLSLHNSTDEPSTTLGDFHAGAMVGGAKPPKEKDGSLRYWGGP